MMKYQPIYWSGRGPALSDVLRATYDKAVKDVNNLDARSFEVKSMEELANENFQSNNVKAPVFDFDNMEVTGAEEDVPFDEHPSRQNYRDYERPRSIKGYVVRISIPFEGEAQVMKFTPNSYTSLLAYGEVRGNKLHYSFTLHAADGKALDAKVDEYLRVLKPYAEQAVKDAEQHNKKLLADLPGLLEARKKKLLADSDGFSTSKYLK